MFTNAETRRRVAAGVNIGAASRLRVAAPGLGGRAADRLVPTGQARDHALALAAFVENRLPRWPGVLTPHTGAGILPGASVNTNVR